VRSCLRRPIVPRSNNVQVFHFDHIGVPSAQQTIAEYRSGEAWQHAKTFERIAKLRPSPPLVFEGQTAIVSRRSCRSDGKHQYTLIDCDDGARATIIA
jgi:hypothetical protein